MTKFFDDREVRSIGQRVNDQNEQLRTMILLGYKHSERVKETLDGLKISPHDINTIGTLEKLPVISREEIVAREMQDPPFGGFSAPDMITDRIFVSPGPVYEPHLSEKPPLWGRGYFAAGFQRGDRVLNTFSYHMVAAGLTFHEGLRSVGATVVPSGTSGTDTQIQLMRDLGVTGYTGTPSFLMAIITKAKELGYDFAKDFTLRRASFVAEPLESSLRRKFEEEYGIDTYQMYGATEVGDIAYECREKMGWHICEDVIVEIVDPATGRKVEPGQLGEVVVTRLNNIFFLFRFATGDLSSIIEELCPCGRTSYRLNGIAGRVGDAVKVRGLFIAPSQLYKLKDHLEGVTFQLVVTRESFRDFLAAFIEQKEDMPNIIDRFESVFSETCTVRIDDIQVIRPGTIGEDAPLIVDKRDWK